MSPTARPPWSFLAVLSFAAFLMAALMAAPGLALAQYQNAPNSAPPRTMTLSATGTINSKPDIATISTGIETVNVRARDALDDNNETMARMMRILTRAGLAKADIATTQFSVQPTYQRLKRRRDGSQPTTPRIIGYTVTNSLHITVRDLEDLGNILDRLVSVGSNRFGGISFGLSEPDKALNEARKEAMRRVLQKARLYAKAANVTLGSIKSISEQAHHASPRMMSRRARGAMAASVPISPGRHKTSVTVHVIWSLEE